MKTKRTLGQIRSLPENVNETRTVQFVISSEKKDRHGTVLDIDGWVMDNYNNLSISIIVAVQCILTYHQSLLDEHAGEHP